MLYPACETEQTLRAEKLAALGLASMLPEDGLTPETMAGAIRAALARRDQPRPKLRLDGADATARLLAELAKELAARR